jgi:peptidoglycan/xylan/chitin deacetylase (PgdA/CDA1 family)
MKRSIKSLAGRVLFSSRLDGRLLGDAGVIVAFHRVHDGAPPDDGLTVSVDVFARYCRFFQRHFRVVPLRELVARLERGVPLERALVITFDDGYRDNFENAAPALAALGLPATFFVVSRWIGTDVVPSWDRDRGVRHPWMTWDQVRALHRAGFEIGVHTRTHVDLGRVAAPEAQQEILGARLELEGHLGTAVESFAYPYGGRYDLSPDSREAVRAAGLRSCCSCFGGVNTSGTDPFHLRRIPISSWYASPHQFGFELVLGRSLVSS